MPKPKPTAASRIPVRTWNNKLSIIRGHLEQEVPRPDDLLALLEYIDLLEAYLDDSNSDGWRQYALGE